MKLAISAKTRDRSRYVELIDITKIGGEVWKNFWFDRREPDAFMLEALARAWPEYGYWLCTGATNVRSGHICPPNAVCYEQNVTPMITAQSQLKTGTELAAAVEATMQQFPEHEEHIASTLHNFLNGKSMHFMEPATVLMVDPLFKKIRALNQINQMSETEAKLQDKQ